MLGSNEDSGSLPDRKLEEDPLNISDEQTEPIPGDQEPEEVIGSWWARFWESVTRAGFSEIFLRQGTHVLLLILILVVTWSTREFYQRARAFEFPNQAVLAAPILNVQSTEIPAGLPPMEVNLSSLADGVVRLSELHTDIPSRPRMEVITYTVETGDTLFGIAEKFGLKPETLLWGNTLTLGDNPHNLRPEQKLNILPTDGTYHRWSEGDGLNGVAEFFGVTVENILDFEGNGLNPDTIGDLSHPNIQPGTWIVIPGGKRSFVSWSTPPGGIPRDNPGVATGFGTGVCGAKVDGALGSGAFIWPTNSHVIGGFNWSPDSNHPGIDINGSLGDPIYASDSGVVVYAGWNNWGYGNVVIVDHGNGWQTLYAHMDSVMVSCGQSVTQGGSIGTIGTTGNSTGPHLHYEMMYNGTKVNPNDYLP